MVWFAVWCASAWAADAAGATDEAYLSGSTIRFGNVSVKAANGDLWFAGEFVDPTVSTTNPGVKVVRRPCRRPAC